MEFCFLKREGQSVGQQVYNQKFDSTSYVLVIPAFRCRLYFCNEIKSKIIYIGIVLKFFEYNA